MGEYANAPWWTVSNSREMVILLAKVQGFKLHFSVCIIFFQEGSVWHSMFISFTCMLCGAGCDDPFVVVGNLLFFYSCRAF